MQSKTPVEPSEIVRKFHHLSTRYYPSKLDLPELDRLRFDQIVSSEENSITIDTFTWNSSYGNLQVILMTNGKCGGVFLGQKFCLEYYDGRLYFIEKFRHMNDLMTELYSNADELQRIIQVTCSKSL